MTIAAIYGGLVLLAVLACPIGMGLMMFFMGRGMNMGPKRTSNDADTPDSSLAELKAEQARLAEKIEALDGSRSEHAPEHETTTA
ncbi:MAG: DUF2933 domain-containing protein [Gaiellaceae bacterium]